MATIIPVTGEITTVAAGEAAEVIRRFGRTRKEKTSDGSAWVFDAKKRNLNRRATLWLSQRKPTPSGALVLFDDRPNAPPLELAGTVVYLSAREHVLVFQGFDPDTWPVLNPHVECGPTWEDLRGVRGTW